MNELTKEQKDTITRLRLEGKALTVKGNSDFRQIRDCCPKLQSIDLQRSDCPNIPPHALHSCHRLKQLVLPDNVEGIGNLACFACDSLTQLTLPSCLMEVGEEAFACLSNLHTLRIEGRPRLGPYAFAGATRLRHIYLSSPVPPQADPTAFAGISSKQIRLHVPEGSLKAYRQAPGWGRLLKPSPLRHDVDSVFIIPIPARLTYTGQRLYWEKIGHIVSSPDLQVETEHALRILHTHTAWKKGKGKGCLTLLTDSTWDVHPETYTMAVTPEGITIKGKTPQGVFHGLMSLEQMLVNGPEGALCASLPTLVIEDFPRTSLRELMVDPARIFISLDDLRPFVVEMARYKFNALHLHLVDDQAWRIEIKSYPRLVEMGSRRTGMDDMPLDISGYYTQEEMKDFIRFAARYHVEVIPEIEMPGHEVAAIHCYPRLTCGAREIPIRTTCGVSNELLCPGEEFVYEFLGNVFRELHEVFPSSRIHLGGDEAGNPPLGCWTHCEKCQALRDRLGIKSTDGSENWKLQEYMFNRIIDTLRTEYGKTPMFWYETDFKRIPEGCITFAWRHGLTAAAIRAAMDNKARIMLCPGEHCYLDYPATHGGMPEVNWGMPVTSLEQTYRLDPAWGMDETFEKTCLYGVAGTLWSECIPTPERLFHQAFPRAMALAEAGWSPQSRRSWSDFSHRVHIHMKGFFYRKCQPAP